MPGVNVMLPGFAVLGALAAGLAGGVLFRLLSLPLPWTLGALAASAVLAVTSKIRPMPSVVRDGARPIVGVMAGSAFTPAVLASLATWWPAIIMVLIYTVVTVFLGWIFFRYAAGLDRTTAFFAAAPGGLSELTLLGSSLGGDLRALVLIHSLRVIVIVFTAPFLVQAIVGDFASATLAARTGPDLYDWLILLGCAFLGWAVGARLHLPGGVVIAALIFSAAVHGLGFTDAAPPGWLVAFVQVVIGTAAGSRFGDIEWRAISLVLLYALAWMLVLVATALAAAFAGTVLLDRSFAVLLLAFMPGGMAEMTVISYSIGIEVAFVVTCQVFRIFSVYTTTPLLFRLLRP